MKKVKVLIIWLLFVVFQVNAQNLTQEEIIGTWTVKKVQSLAESSGENKKIMEMLMDAFLKSKFHFKADYNFTLDFSFDEMKIKNGHWKFNPDTNSIIIQEWKDKDTNKWKLMEIIVKKESDKIIFQLLESFLVLEMKKEK